MANIIQLPNQGRRLRRPQHTFQVRHLPYQIQPFCIAPVLPGETMRNLLMQSRVVTDPIRNPLIGWWIEYYFFYVKHRDLAERSELESMVLDPTWNAGNIDDTVDSAPFYHQGEVNAVNFTQLCLKRVTEEFFRDEGVAWNAHIIDGVPLASITGNSWLDSVINDTDYIAPDVSVSDIDAHGDSEIYASEIERAMAQWEYLKLNGLTTQSYEEFLQTYGVRLPQVELHRPELLRFVREWSYPTNTVDPTTGAPSSAVSWSVAERADKDRFFTEPGFVFGVTVCRPKVYLSGQKGAVSHFLNDVYSWLPAVMDDNPQTSLKRFASGTGPLPGNTDAYWIDVKDLFLYGDQFVNFALDATDAGLVPLPTAGLQKRYVPTEADIWALFVDEGEGENDPTKVLCRQDGIVNLTIAGRVQDTSGRTITHL